jgi:hypothetical protein
LLGLVVAIFEVSCGFQLSILHKSGSWVTQLSTGIPNCICLLSQLDFGISACPVEYGINCLHFLWVPYLCILAQHTICMSQLICGYVATKVMCWNKYFLPSESVVPKVPMFAYSAIGELLS